MEEKQLYEHFKPQTSDFSCKKTWIGLRRGNLKRERETEYLLVAAQNNVMMNNYEKQELSTRNKIADEAYVVIETKR